MVQWGGPSRDWFLIYAWSKLPLLKPRWGCWGCSKELPMEWCLPGPMFGPNSHCCCSWKPHWWCWGCDGELLVESCLPWLCESATTTTTTKFNRLAKPWLTHITIFYIQSNELIYTNYAPTYTNHSPENSMKCGLCMDSSLCRKTVARAKSAPAVSEPWNETMKTTQWRKVYG